MPHCKPASMYHRSIHLAIYDRSNCLAGCRCIDLSIDQSICLSIYLSTYLPICLSLCPPIIYLSTYPSIYPGTNPSVYDRLCIFLAYLDHLPLQTSLRTQRLHKALAKAVPFLNWALESS